MRRAAHGAERRAVASLALLLTSTLFGCAAPPSDPPERAVAASLAFDAQGRLWVASPDDGALVSVDPQTLAVADRVPVDGEPHRVLAIDDRLFVIGARSDRLTEIGRPAIPLPCGGATGMARLGDRLFIACPFDDRVVEVDVASRAVQRVLSVAGRPSAVAIVDGRLLVGGAGLRAVALSDLPAPGPTPVALTWQAHPLPTRGDLTPGQLDALALAGDRLVGAYQIVQQDGDRDRDPATGGYGTVIDGDPRIEPRVLADCGSAYARFDGGRRAMSGPAALALDAARARLWVVHRGTGQVAVFACPSGASAAQLPLVATFSVGAGARGIVLAPDGSAYVDVAFDYAIAHLRVGEAPVVRARETGPRSLSRAAERGRRLFHDARNVHLTPSGVVTCATCHPDGGDDGLSWFLHTPNVTRKLRRTPPAWAIRPEIRPLHWDGEFTRAEDLVTTTLRELLEGDGLLIDGAAIAAWMRERPPPIPRPLSADEAAQAARGAVVFEMAGCAECHPAPDYTDGRLAAVLDQSSDPDGRLAAAVTPSLTAIRARAPYFHDGRATTLEAVLTMHAPSLAQEARADLLGFLRSL